MDEFLNKSGRKDKILIAVVTFFFAALIFLPSLVAILPIERSKWYVAAAKQAYETSKDENDPKREQARQYLARAKEINPEIVESEDYEVLSFKTQPKMELPEAVTWLKGYRPEARSKYLLEVLIDYVKAGDVDSAIKLFEDAFTHQDFQKLSESTRFDLVSIFVSLLFDDDRYEKVIQTIANVYPDLEDRPTSLNNSYAYACSLAGTQLEEAEKAIDLVLSENRNRGNSAFLDTKAWVMHAQGRHLEALPVMQDAILNNYTELVGQLRSTDTAIFASPQKSMIKVIKDIQRRDAISSFSNDQLLEALAIAESNATQQLQSNQSNEKSTEEKPPSDEQVAELAEVTELGPDDADNVAADLEQNVATEEADDADELEFDSLPAETGTKESLPEASQDRAKKLAETLAANAKKVKLPLGIKQNDPVLKGLAIYRYHRAEILKASGFERIAELEFVYLRANGFEDFDELN